MMSLDEIADELCRRILAIFLRGPDGRRPVFGHYEKFQVDPHFKDYILFHEYFHGDNGRGCGASHQTGWTGLIANLIKQLAAKEENASAVPRAHSESAGFAAALARLTRHRGRETMPWGTRPSRERSREVTSCH